VTAASPGGSILATEVFSAIQGEAALVGERQVFVRLTGCNIRCAYCDQPEALERRPGPCRLERTPGRRDWQTVASPLPVPALASAVDDLWRLLPHHSVSLTGGEPLLQARAVVDLAARLAASGYPVMLETNGTLVGTLNRILPSLSYVSMDVKLPSVDGERVRPDVQRRFLRSAVGAGVTTWVKVVVGAATDPAEFDRAIGMVAEAAGGSAPGPGGPEVFLQPVTPFGGVGSPPSPDQVLELQERALHRYPRVRVVPQTHKAIGQL
jgi:organic radical activating enzyme